MFSWWRSLRVRLQLWHALMLCCVVIGFGSVLYRQIVTSRWEEVDSQLLAAGRLIDGALRNMPRSMLDGMGPELGPVESPWHTISMDGPAYYIIWRRDGTVLHQRNVPYSPPPRPAENLLINLPRYSFRPETGPLRQIYQRGPHNTLICVGKPVHHEQGGLHRLAWQLALSGCAILVAGLCGGWWLSRRAILPIENMTSTAEAITADNLSQRMDLSSVDIELEKLGLVLNNMLARLEQAFESQRRFTADASHELRTPLATLLSTIELALSKSRSTEEYQQHLQKCKRAAKRMQGLVESMLTLARTEAASSRASTTALSLDQLVDECCQSVQDLAVSHEVTLQCHLEPVQVCGSWLELSQAVTNLISNAIVYNNRPGKVEIELRPSSDHVVLKVTDTGVGISEADLPHIFERFFRADPSRNKSASTVGGNGLGLAICQRIVQSHQGKLEVASRPGKGTTFTMVLPRA